MPAETVTGAQLLAQFLQCRDEPQAQAILSQLVWEEAAPVVKGIVLGKVARDGKQEQRADTDDVCNDILADLVGRLRELKEDGKQPAIRDFSAYVAVAAYHGCNDYFRCKFPQRHRLKNKIRYVLGKDRRFALWQDANGEWYCGRWEWRNRKPASVEPLQGLDSEDDFGQARTRETAAVVASIFEECRSPLLFDDLVRHLADLWGIVEERVSADSNRFEAVDPREGPEEALETRTWLNALWEEIGELPLRQRVCLLLNLRDHGGSAAITLLPVTGVASIREIAAKLEMAAEELARLWNTLPMEDSRIAERLAITRQQVINLRKSARERLARKVRR